MREEEVTICYQIASAFPHRCGGICRPRAAASKGPFSFAKENDPFGTPRERLRLAVSGLRKSLASGMEMPARGVAAFSVATRLASASIIAVAQPLAALPPYGCGTPLAGAALLIL